MIGESSRERHDRLDQTEISSLKILKANNVQPIILGPYHYLIKKSDIAIDYWPRTGLFIDRKDKKRGRGVFNLLKKLNIKKPIKPKRRELKCNQQSGDSES